MLTLLTAEAMHDIAHFLRPAHLAQLRSIIDDPEAAPNDRFVALDLLRNANIAAGGVLPMCQDTGTAIVMGKRGRHVLTDGADEAAHRPGRLPGVHPAQSALLAARPADHVGRDATPAPTCRPRSSSTPRTAGDATYKFLFMAKGGGSANKSYLYQETKALLNPARMMEFLDEKLRSIGTAACPPYHLAVVIGGTSAEYALKTAKLASAKYLDNLPHRGLDDRARLPRRRAGGGGPGADPQLRHRRAVRRPVLLPRRTGDPAAPARRVLPGGDRGLLLGRPAGAREDHPAGVWLERLETDPARFLPESPTSTWTDDVVRIDLNRPMDEIRAELSKYPVKTRLSLTGPLVVARDIAHAKIAERLDAGEPMPQYLRDHAVYYAGPAKTPEGYASGSFGPTTAGRMDSYVEKFQAAGGSLVMLAKGNRSPQVTNACAAARRLLPRLDRRPGGPAGPGLHHARRGAGVPGAGHGGGLEDRGARTSRPSSSSTTRATTSSPRSPRPVALTIGSAPVARRSVRPVAADADGGDYRIEHDSMGEVRVPAERCGAPDAAGGGELPGLRAAAGPRTYRGAGAIKAAAARVNARAGRAGRRPGGADRRGRAER